MILRQGNEMRKLNVFSAGLAALVGLSLASDAFARPRYRVSGGPDQGSVRRNAAPGYGAPGPYDPPGRSWLEPGTQVSPGSQHRYMVEQTYLRRDPIQKNQRSWYMNETLPQPLYNEWDPGLPVDLQP